MKKIISIIIILLLLAFSLVLVLNTNKITGQWACSKYSLYSKSLNAWQDQDKTFTKSFGLKIFKGGKLIVNTFGNEAKGDYIFKNDTLLVTVKNMESKYVYSKGLLTLIDHPTAKIEYTRKGKVENE